MNDPKLFAKSTVRTLAHPIWRRMWDRIESRLSPLEARLRALETTGSQPTESERSERIALRTVLLESQARALADQGLAALQRVAVVEARLDEQTPIVQSFERGWRAHVPSFLNAVSSVRAFAHELATMRADLTRVERIADEERASRDEFRELRDRLPAMLNAMSSVPALAMELTVVRGALESLRASVESELSEKRDADASRLSERESLRQQIATLNADLQTVSHNVSGSIADLWQRIEFVRKEIMNEVAYGERETAPIAAGVVNHEKVRLQTEAGNVRVNVGCGHIALDDYLNVDSRALPGVDIVADIAALPFEHDSIAEFFSSHVLEHFPQERLKRLLPYWRQLLRSGGTFRAVVPDGKAMLDNLSSGIYPFESFRQVLFGGQEYQGDFHYNLFTPATLRALLEEAGFTDVHVPVEGRVNGDCYEFEISATKR